jgi:hypothetical protein
VQRVLLLVGVLAPLCAPVQVLSIGRIAQHRAATIAGIGGAIAEKASLGHGNYGQRDYDPSSLAAMPPTKRRSSEATVSRTLPQSPALDCRKSRAL